MLFLKGRGPGSTLHGKYIPSITSVSLQILIVNLRNFVATQMKGVSCAVYQKFPSKVEAEMAFRQATGNSYVVAL